MSTILIAYEREMEQNALEKLLGERGHTIIRSSNGVDALDAARRELPHLIISDILLPKMDGFALLKKWKQDDHLQNVPFMFYTRRHDDPKYERFALELGTDRYVERSTDPAALYKAVDEMLAEGAVARRADTQRLKALSTGSFTATSRIAAVQSATAQSAPANGASSSRMAPTGDAEPKSKPNGKARIEPIIEAPPPSVNEAMANPNSNAANVSEITGINPAMIEDRSLAREARLLARVTELDALNKQLQASEQRFRQLFEGSPIPLWLLNADDRQCVAVNSAALSLYGFSREEFLALPRSSPPFAAGAPISGTNAAWHRTKSGNAIAVELSSKQVELGTRRGEVIAAHDVTQRIFAHQASAHASDAYQSLFVAAPDGIWLLDDKSKFFDVNEAYCRMSGYSRDELLKLTPSDLEVRMLAESTIRLHQTAERKNENQYETMHRRKDGSLYPVEVSVGELTGARSRTIVMIRDATNKQAKQQTEQQVNRAQVAALELFNQASRMDEQSIVRRATELAAGITVSPLCFFASNDQSASLYLSSIYEQSRGVAVPASGDSRKLSVQGPLSLAVRTGQPIYLNDAKKGEVASNLPAQTTLLVMPVVGDDEQLGALAVANRNAMYTQHDQRLLTLIAGALGSILQVKRAQAQTLVTAQRADVALQGIIEGLSRVVERHDPHTSGGPRRVAALAVAIAREVGLSQQQQDALRTAGLLHGVGNIAIPSALLAKPSALSEAELALVRTHVEEGRKILAEIEFGSPVSEIVYQHHERMDGSGYPRGLRGDAIMIEARILAVADVIEAMCASRPHRPAPGLDAALQEVEQGAGRIYDSRVASVCVRLFRENGFKLPE